MLECKTAVPKKLKQDAIVEAVFEIRFALPPASLSEVILGRLADHETWEGYEQRRMFAAQVPDQIRQIDPSFRFQPLLELVPQTKELSVRIGPQVLSFHRMKPYVGWEKFKPELLDALDALFKAAKRPTITRLGLRYINALRPDDHAVKSISDLSMVLKIGDKPIGSNVNVNLSQDLPNNSQCTIRIATPEYVQGELPPGTSVFVDVDVFTKDTFSSTDKQTVVNWLDFAHTQEKEHFFCLFPQ